MSAGAPCALGQVGVHASLTVDNLFALSISAQDDIEGTTFLEGDAWWSLMSGHFEFPAPGRYFLHVRAVNQGGPGMFIGRFELDEGAVFANGTRTLLSGRDHWLVSATGFGSAYVAPEVLGANGAFPWGLFSALGDASYVWHPTEPGTVFFSAVIDVGLPSCYADCDTSTGVGVLDIFDFLCFQNRFATSAGYACDCDTSSGPGVCDIFDFLCFQNAFAAGCP